MMVMLNILFASAPLMAAAMGSLISDCAGRLAIFMEGMINLSAFLCFAFTVKCSVISGCALSIFVCVLIALLFTAITQITGADPFLMGLSLNVISGGAVSLLSSAIFKTRGVLTDRAFAFDPQSVRIASSVASFALVAAATVLLLFTKRGLYMRLCGNDNKLLNSRGVSSTFYVCLSWPLAAVFAAAAGAQLSLRLSSFVPGISSGTGYISLVAVYMGKSITQDGTHNLKSCALAFLSVYLVSAALEAAARMQNVFPEASSALLLSMPYLAALILLFISGILARIKSVTKDWRIL